MTAFTDELSALGVRPNKALGQNFLCDEAAIETIVSFIAEPGLPVIEIGPGLGAITLPLAKRGVRIACVELDSKLSELLSGELAPYPEARVVNADFLKTDIKELAASLGGGRVAVAGNLPYYITSPICTRLVNADAKISVMTLMMQTEAAERFFAEPGDGNYGPLTVMAGLKYDIETVLNLSPSAYYPQPEVSSTVLGFKATGAELPKGLFGLLKCAFAMRRKTLYNNLPAMGLTKRQAAQVIEECGLPSAVRAEALTKEQFAELALKIERL